MPKYLDLDVLNYAVSSLAQNITNNFVFTNDNLKALLSSDIAYISGHGSRGGAIPIYKNGVYPDSLEVECEMFFNQIISTDQNIGTAFQDMGLFQTE